MDDPYAMIELVAWMTAIIFLANFFMWFWKGDGRENKKND